MTNFPPRSPAQFPALDFPPDLPIEYVNLVRIAHSISELVFDFAHILPGAAPAKVTSRVVNVAAQRQAFCPGSKRKPWQI